MQIFYICKLFSKLLKPQFPLLSPRLMCACMQTCIGRCFISHNLQMQNTDIRLAMRRVLWMVFSQHVVTYFTSTKKGKTVAELSSCLSGRLSITITCNLEEEGWTDMERLWSMKISKIIMGVGGIWKWSFDGLKHLREWRWSFNFSTPHIYS